MKTLKHISALLVVASTFLSSCSLLVSSPIHSPGPHHFLAGPVPSPYRGNPQRVKKVYNGIIQVSAGGGIYQFECADDQFYISRIFDSSMPVLHNYSNCRYSPKSDDYISVDDLTYSGSFYTITCNKDEHNWVINIDPLTESDFREIRVFMWDGSDDSNFIFRFEQSDFNDDECIE